MKYAHKTTFQRSIDGDTIVVLLDCGVRVYSSQVIRLARINAPEMNDPTPEGKEKAHKARDFIVSFFVPSWECEVETIRQDPYGRWVGEVTRNGKNLSDELLRAGLAVPYPKPKGGDDAGLP